MSLEGKDAYSPSMFHDVCLHRRVLIAGTFGFDTKVDCTVVELPEPIGFLTHGVMVWKGFPYRGAMSKMYVSSFSYPFL